MSKDGQPAGFLQVEPTTYWEAVGGALWWRRFSDIEWAAQVWYTFRRPGWGVNYSGQIIPPEAVADALDDWDAGRFEVIDGEVVTLRWLDAGEAARVASGELPG